MKSLTDYEKYIRTEELLQLQKSDKQLCCPDELTFQMIHQIAELHFKLVIQYIHRVKGKLEKKEVGEATVLLQGINQHIRLLPELFRMMERLQPIDYHTIRLALGQGSGQDSPGFNQVLKDAPILWPPFETLLNDSSITLIELHKRPQDHYGLFLLVQELIAFDQGFQNFRYQHLQLVSRMIGLETNSLKGIPAKMLQKGVHHQLYPPLWTVISDLTDLTGSSYNPKPLDE